MMSDRPADAAAEPATGPADGEPGPADTSAPGGWRRVLLGLLVGVAFGALLALVLPRERPRDQRPPDGPSSLPPSPSGPLSTSEDLEVSDPLGGARDDDGTDR